MTPLEQFVQEGYKVFSGYERPPQCIDHQGDPEYKKHEESLQGVTCSTMEIKHLGHIGWGPLYALGPEAVAHFMPKLIEFSVQGKNDKLGEPFMVRFITAFGTEWDSGKFLLFGYTQREFMFRTFLLLKGLYYDRFKELGYKEELDEAIEQWEM